MQEQQITDVCGGKIVSKKGMKTLYVSILGMMISFVFAVVAAYIYCNPWPCTDSGLYIWPSILSGMVGASALIGLMAVVVEYVHGAFLAGIDAPQEKGLVTLFKMMKLLCVAALCATISPWQIYLGASTTQHKKLGQGVVSYGHTVSSRVGFATLSEHIWGPNMYEDEFAKRVRAGEYEIDGDGKIWRLWAHGSPCDKCGHIKMRAIKRKRAESPNGNGYLRIKLNIGVRKNVDILSHRAVWVCFNDPIPEGLEINHKNGNRTDNRPTNLEVVSRTENVYHSMKVLDRVGGRRLSNADIKNIRKKLDDGVRQIDVAMEFGVRRGTIYKIKNRRSWKHV